MTFAISLRLTSWLYRLGLFAALFSTSVATGASLPLPSGKLHLRSGSSREWRSFPEVAGGRTARVPFDAEANGTEHTLVLRQSDVKKANWAVSLNGEKLGVLQADERPMIRMFSIPAGTLRSGQNMLEIIGNASGFSDDIEVRDMRIEPIPVNRLLAQSTISVDAAGEHGPMPVKITIVDREGSLVPFTSLRPEAHEAQRTGVIYVAEGKARISVPAGQYKVYASRGFEYSAPSERVRVQPGTGQAVRLRLRKEVNLPGYVSCDPHVHTFELSRHGDASVDERVLTAAGEGLDFIVSTEHNRVDDYSTAVKRRGLDKWTRAVPGSEVTTSMGHFNIFPARPGTPQPDPRSPDWSALLDSIQRTEGVQVVVQNHPRDLHLNYRPFDPAHHLSSIGANVAGRPVRANAMEVVNSGAMQSDVMQPVRDWLGLLTRGLRVAAIGSSDTHTVDLVPIGQARTYIEARPDGPTAVFAALAEGRSLVSYGLAAEVRAASAGVDVIVHGPSWSSVDTIDIYSNGKLVWRDSFAPVRKAGVKYRRSIRLALPRHDAAIVAVASGPGVLEPFWAVRKPYQPVSDDWTPRVLGISSAVWVDGDGDGMQTSPLAYAERLLAASAGDLNVLVRRLVEYDRSVTMHALELLRSRGELDSHVRTAFKDAPGAVGEGYALFVQEISRLKA